MNCEVGLKLVVIILMLFISKNLWAEKLISLNKFKVSKINEFNKNNQLSSSHQRGYHLKGKRKNHYNRVIEESSRVPIGIRSKTPKDSTVHSRDLYNFYNKNRGFYSID